MGALRRALRRARPRSRLRDGPRDQRGAATVLAVTFVGLLLFVGAALGVVQAMVRAHRLAQSAADLAALAGAGAVQHGGDGCTVAAAVAAANQSRLTACVVTGDEVRLEVAVTGPHWLGQQADLTAEARAGPA